ncbi:MAG: branched-chain amino acid transaminase [Chloroflexi bacterium]|nr:branched-chain amino acid transaminase [Chloroflexota bacterium]
MPQYAFFDGRTVPLSEANISILTHGFLYGTACFEGIRANWDGDQLYVFRAADHFRRLLDSCRVLQIELPYSAEDLVGITVGLLEKCGYREDVYIRPVAYKSSQGVGVRLHDVEAALAISVLPYDTPPGVATGIRCCISTWQRIDDNVIPPRAKITGLYVNSALARSEAVAKGYDEAILLTREGHVSEGPGENLFVVSGGRLVTPPVYDNILVGITRDTVMVLARDELGMVVHERYVDRSELYLSDECFLAGTLAHLTPVVEVDGRPIGQGKVGPVTLRLQELYFAAVRGALPEYGRWCTPVYRDPL